jgi:hypothetical protein
MLWQTSMLLWFSIVFWVGLALAGAVWLVVIVVETLLAPLVRVVVRRGVSKCSRRALVHASATARVARCCWPSLRGYQAVIAASRGR